VQPLAQHTPLIATITIGLVLAFIFGAAAHRLRISPLVGYLIAGIVVGPNTPGFVADQTLAFELAEIGVILLMFGVGLHFSLKDLLDVRAIAIPGALAQMAVATLFGMGLARLQGWPAGNGFVFGLALSVASTVVLMRAVQEHRLIETKRGRIAVGWLVVQDLAMVIALLLLPALADLLQTGESSAAAFRPPARDIVTVLAVTLGKFVVFIALMLIVGRRVIPWILHYIAHTGSRELFRLAVLAVALGVAFGASELFGISLALGAFIAGMILHESPLSQRAAEESLPLRDAFAVLFFVSIGMLVDPTIIVREPWPLLGTLFVVLVLAPAAAFLIVRAFGRPVPTALTISVSLAQIGEFSFILAGLGVSLRLLPPEARDLILAGAFISIVVNPFLFVALERFGPRLSRRAVRRRAERLAAGAQEVSAEEMPMEPHPTRLAGHAVIVGYGRVGSAIGEGLRRQGRPLLVVEERDELAAELARRGIEVIVGNAVRKRVLQAANLAAARWLFVAIPDGFEAGQVVEQARAVNPKLDIIARAHSDAEVEHLTGLGASRTIMGEREIAQGMLEHALGKTSPASGQAGSTSDRRAGD
jgi:CPA2 family monovalent cation:H+ antiporter-2